MTSIMCPTAFRLIALKVGFHPNLVTLIGVVTRGNPKIMLVSYCENGDLRDYLKKNAGQLGSQKKVKMLVETARGMAHLAKMCFVHRDLAARNVLLNSSLNCLVSDFGLSRGTGEGNGEYYACSEGLFPIRWTAPDVIKTMRYTQYSDSWSWGILGIEVSCFFFFFSRCVCLFAMRISTGKQLRLLCVTRILSKTRTAQKPSRWRCLLFVFLVIKTIFVVMS